MTLLHSPRLQVRGPLALTQNLSYQSLLRFRRSHKDRLKRSKDHPRHPSLLRAVFCRRLALCALHQMERGDRLGSVVHTFISRKSQLIRNPGDKANHIPAFHIPQIYYFIAFSTVMGWPALISGEGGPGVLMHGITARMWGSKRSVTRSPFV